MRHRRRNAMLRRAARLDLIPVSAHALEDAAGFAVVVGGQAFERAFGACSGEVIGRCVGDGGYEGGGEEGEEDEVEV
jgi:hypothetical protein